MVNSIDVMTTTLTANPSVTNWIFYSCNDDGVLGAARALENAGYSADQGMGIGIDGSRACDAFGSGKPSAFRGTMWLNSANHGALAVKLLLASIKDETALPVQSFTDPEYITLANFANFARLCPVSVAPGHFPSPLPKAWEREGPATRPGCGRVRAGTAGAERLPALVPATCSSPSHPPALRSDDGALPLR